MQQSLEHLRIKKIASSEDSSSEIDFDNEVVVKFTGTYDAASIANMEMPDVMILDDDIRSGRVKSLHGSIELDFVKDPSLEFSRTLVETMQEHKRSLLNMVQELEAGLDRHSEAA